MDIGKEIKRYTVTPTPIQQPVETEEPEKAPVKELS